MVVLLGRGVVVSFNEVVGATSGHGYGCGCIFREAGIANHWIGSDGAPFQHHPNSDPGKSFKGDQREAPHFLIQAFVLVIVSRQ